MLAQFPIRTEHLPPHSHSLSPHSHSLLPRSLPSLAPKSEEQLFSVPQLPHSLHKTPGRGVPPIPPLLRTLASPATQRSLPSRHYPAATAQPSLPSGHCPAVTAQRSLPSGRCPEATPPLSPPSAHTSPLQLLCSPPIAAKQKLATIIASSALPYRRHPGGSSPQVRTNRKPPRRGSDASRSLSTTTHHPQRCTGRGGVRIESHWEEAL